MNERRMRCFPGFTAMVVGCSLALHVTPAEAQTMQATSYSTIQADAGRALYPRLCAPCHGAALEGGEAGPALRGQVFMNKWREKPFAELFEQTRRTMPVTQPAGLSREQYEQLLAYVMESNGIAASSIGAGCASPQGIARYRVAAASRRRRQPELLGAGPDRPQQHLAPEGCMALAERQLRCLDLSQLRSHAADGRWRALHHRRCLAHGGGHRCAQWRDAVDASPRRRAAR